MVTFTENSKVPDGALPNSTILELREALIVRMPGVTAATTLPLSGAMWTLTLIHLPAFRNPLIMVANLDNSEMSAGDRVALLQDWNSSNLPPVYPDWRLLTGAVNTYYSVVQWTGLQRVDPPTETGTTAIQQFRITADGMTVFNNTPDLINQGMVIGAQWPANRAIKTEESDQSIEGFNGSAQVVSVNSNLRLDIALPIAQPGTVVSSTNFTAAIYGGPNYPYNFIGFTCTTVPGAIIYTQDCLYECVVNGQTSTAGDTWTYTVSRLAAGAWDFSLVNSTTSTTLISFTGVVNPNLFYPIIILSALEMPTITTLQLPPTDTQNIIQSTPKAVYMSAKEQNGVYMVKRIFQPIFNVQEASERRQVVLTSTDYERQLSFAPQDVLDLNYGVGVTVWSSIPTSCAPAIKLIRDVEIVAGEDSPYMPFMKSNEDKCEAALSICHAMAVHHPFLYPESYNILGGLMGLIGNVVSKVPILGNIVGAIPGIIKGITGGETTSTSGASQNRLTSTNIEELSKLAQTLMAQLKLS